MKIWNLRRIVIETAKEVQLEVNIDKNKYMVTGGNGYKKTDMKFLDNADNGLDNSELNAFYDIINIIV